jgi:hypothetical protein
MLMQELPGLRFFYKHCAEFYADLKSCQGIWAWKNATPSGFEIPI